MPFSGMGVSFKAVVPGYKGFTYRSFAGTFFLAYRDRYNFHIFASALALRAFFYTMLSETERFRCQCSGFRIWILVLLPDYFDAWYFLQFKASIVICVIPYNFSVIMLFAHVSVRCRCRLKKSHRSPVNWVRHQLFFRICFPIGY